MKETEAQRNDRLMSVATEDISSVDCAYCQQLRGERKRYRDHMEDCEMHGTKDMFTTVRS